jgi:hypothetical protein
VGRVLHASVYLPTTSALVGTGVSCSKEMPQRLVASSWISMLTTILQEQNPSVGYAIVSCCSSTNSNDLAKCGLVSSAVVKASRASFYAMMFYSNVLASASSLAATSTSSACIRLVLTSFTPIRK